MPRHPNLTRSRSIQDAYTIATLPVLDFLTPAVQPRAIRGCSTTRRYSTNHRPFADGHHAGYENLFFSAIARASTCAAHRVTNRSGRTKKVTGLRNLTAGFATTITAPYVSNDNVTSSPAETYEQELPSTSVNQRDGPSSNHGAPTQEDASQEGTLRTSRSKALRWLHGGHETPEITVNSWFPPTFFNNVFERRFAESSRLPPDFFGDVNELRSMTKDEIPGGRDHIIEMQKDSHVEGNSEPPSSSVGANALEEQMNLLKSVRELEEKLAAARQRLREANEQSIRSSTGEASTTSNEAKPEVTLSKEDYMNLVDLYYHSYNSRFSPESTDLSPTPTFLDDYSFQLSRDFAQPEFAIPNEDEDYESPLKQIHEDLKSEKLKEIQIMQIFVDLLLDEGSSNRALYEAYEALPKPGVAYLPRGILRMFLQRMATPWTHSETSMLRYLSLIDQMQKENIPMTSMEWSAAVYLAGRSFSRVTEIDVSSSFKIWQEMEHEAGVKSHHVTFNILFDIAVRAGKYALAQTILMEMSQRNLRLNRLGRVSLIYYHGLRGDGDGVRKTYRDFVEAGEIVDTLVLNCVIASLFNAKEPSAAEQVYERMKSMYSRLRKGVSEDGSEAYYTRYPGPGESTIGREMASNHLGRILVGAARLKEILPEHHEELQASMPLVPNFTTFRAMIAYHATVTGDLDRISILLQEMTDVFGMKLQSLVFQLLFKGFALHGPIGGPHGAWSVKRLDLCWQAFRDAFKEGRAIRRAMMMSNEPDPDQSLPSITQVNAIPINPYSSPFRSVNDDDVSEGRFLGWNNFVLDLASFPPERLQRIQQFHEQMARSGKSPKTNEPGGSDTFTSPFFQSAVHETRRPGPDNDEGDYVLPNPIETTIVDRRLRIRREISYMDEEHDFDDSVEHSFHDEGDHLDMYLNPARTAAPKPPGQTFVTPNRRLVCWLLRAYARNTRSRARVEEVWGAVRKMWQPRNPIDREIAIRVLRRCLRDCDREGSG